MKRRVRIGADFRSAEDQEFKLVKDGVVRRTRRIEASSLVGWPAF